MSKTINLEHTVIDGVNGGFIPNYHLIVTFTMSYKRYTHFTLCVHVHYMSTVTKKMD